MGGHSVKRSPSPPFPKGSSAETPKLDLLDLLVTTIFFSQCSSPIFKMISRSALRASTASSMIGRRGVRGFHLTPARFGMNDSPYHYPEGPGSNLPFNAKTKYFAVRYWGTMGSPTSGGQRGSDSLTHTQHSSSVCPSASQVRTRLDETSFSLAYITLVWQTYKNK
ncbi:MAG: hypothetical protein L6R40_002700 [Gallowayella cf. fulva]|nr:MAG: hypothetical protein L6R40_002700 [Xanthomendoza cf. fulva]